KRARSRLANKPPAGLGLDRMSERRRYNYNWVLKEKRPSQIYYNYRMLKAFFYGPITDFGFSILEDVLPLVKENFYTFAGVSFCDTLLT
ncbi:MAG: hypothetical protein LWW94_08375, partial [Candidatus Desulfofervidaceae bacterium]|nr:hypothetical protein [Candidatus Desulfofervidaceae bacterium]